MNTKEKLELLWKYLLLLILTITLFRISEKSHFKIMEKHFDHSKHSVSLYGDDNHEMDVRVEKEIVNGDTVMTITINGELVDALELEEADGKMKWISNDGKVIVINLGDNQNDDHTEKDVRIIKKKIIIRDDN